MKAGLELDALIAEKVMGWHFVGTFTLDPELNCDRWARDQNGLERYFHEVPKYSTDIAAAWQVVEKMIVYSEHHFLLDKGGAWLCRFREGGLSPGETAPHAICLAALKAVGWPIQK